MAFRNGVGRYLRLSKATASPAAATAAAPAAALLEKEGEEGEEVEELHVYSDFLRISLEVINLTLSVALAHK